MAQPLQPLHPISKDTSAAGAAPLLAGAGFAALVLIATLALWFHYGTQVFFETIRAGFSACF